MSDTAAKKAKKAKDLDDTAITFIEDEVKKDEDLPPPLHGQFEQREPVEELETR